MGSVPKTHINRGFDPDGQLVIFQHVRFCYIVHALIFLFIIDSFNIITRLFSFSFRPVFCYFLNSLSVMPGDGLA